MEWILWAAAVLLTAVVLALAVKIHLLRRSAREIAAGLSMRLSTDTNTLIGISSRDRAMRALAESINTDPVSYTHLSWLHPAVYRRARLLRRIQRHQGGAERARPVFALGLCVRRENGRARKSSSEICAKYEKTIDFFSSQ